MLTFYGLLHGCISMQIPVCIDFSFYISNGYQEVDSGLPKTDMENNNKWLKHSKYSDVR